MIFKIKGVVQHYNWGGTQFISALLKEEFANPRCAEYWMGAHDSAPSKILPTGQALNQAIQANKAEYLGDAVAERFGRLPFLFKVLDVHDMLSIQVHPSKEEAEIGFKRENQQEIPLSSPTRNFKDDNHKPEIMVALGDFWLLHGFMSKSALSQRLAAIPEFDRLKSVFESKGYKGLYQRVMEEDIEITHATLQPLMDRILPLYEKGALEKSSPDFWAARAYQTFCTDGTIDKGIYSIFFFNIVGLKAGEAIFQHAGVPHSYLEGQNMELMANSDNVLRAGLTPKHIDVDMLMQHVVFESVTPQVIKGKKQEGEVETVYESSVPDFEICKLEFNEPSVYSGRSSSMEVIFQLAGCSTINGNNQTVSLKKGECVAIGAGIAYAMEAEENAIAFKARCPV